MKNRFISFVFTILAVFFATNKDIYFLILTCFLAILAVLLERD